MLLGISEDSRFSISDHRYAVFVVDVRNGKTGVSEQVEEMFFRVAIVLEGFVEIEVVASEVGKDTSVELQAGYALLGYRM